ELGPGMEPLRARFYRSRIRSDARLDYDRLDQIFAGRTRPPAEVAEPLAAAREIAAGLGEGRGAAGLEVESAEPEVEFAPEGALAPARAGPQTGPPRLTGRLMTLTTERAARLRGRGGVPAVSRAPAQPDAAGVGRLLGQLAALGVPPPPLGQGLSPRE